jgi:hypothetical protein
MILQGAVSLSQKAGAAVGEIPEQDSCHAVHNMCVELRECVKSKVVYLPQCIISRVRHVFDRWSSCGMETHIDDTNMACAHVTQ